LHSHVAVIAAERHDGKVAAVESRQLFRAARESGAWYRGELAANLGDLGLGIERRQGRGERYFGIEGVGDELSEHWSTRAGDVDRAAQIFRTRYGREPRAGELDGITLGTRGSKSAAARAAIDAAWRALGEEHGLSQSRPDGLFSDRTRHREEVDLRGELLAEVTSERAMITERELRAKAYELSAGAARPGDAAQLLNDLARSGDLIRLQDATWTTRRLRELEEEGLAIAERRAGERAAGVGEGALKQARRELGRELKGGLTAEQREALETITGPGGVAVLVGRAGTGKGVVMAAAARAWGLEGNRVIGTAVAGATAQRLAEEAKLDAGFTADSLIGGAEHGHTDLDSKSVVIMDEAGMADTERLAKLTKLTERERAKLVLVGDAAQLSSIGAGGIFNELEGRAPTAELSEVHRANHDWERRAWEGIRAGEPGPALAAYRAHDRVHIDDTTAEAAEAMVDNWDRTRRSTPDAQAVMITDASNRERDQINAMAQERRAAAGELGAARVELQGKPYGLAAGDEIIFTGQYRVQGGRRVENGITGKIVDARPDAAAREQPSAREQPGARAPGPTAHEAPEQDRERPEHEPLGRPGRPGRVTISTREREPREVEVDTENFSDLSLAYAVHVHKAQGLTTETSGIMIGGWQTDRERAYVAVSRAREQTQIYLSREDLGEQGMDPGAIERLSERIAQSRAQQASITRDQATPTAERNENTIEASGQANQPARPDTRMPIDIQAATPSDVQLNTADAGEKQLGYSDQLFTVGADTGEPTFVLFGGWQTDQQLGYVAVTHRAEGTNVHTTTEDRGERDIETEVHARIGETIERGQAREPANTPAPQNNREPSPPARPRPPAHRAAPTRTGRAGRRQPHLE